jgi:hypothetical protein
VTEIFGSCGRSGRIARVQFHIRRIAELRLHLYSACRTPSDIGVKDLFGKEQYIPVCYPRQG